MLAAGVLDGAVEAEIDAAAEEAGEGTGEGAAEDAERTVPGGEERQDGADGDPERQADADALELPEVVRFANVRTADHVRHQVVDRLVVGDLQLTLRQRRRLLRVVGHAGGSWGVME